MIFQKHHRNFLLVVCAAVCATTLAGCVTKPARLPGNKPTAGNQPAQPIEQPVRANGEPEVNEEVQAQALLREDAKQRRLQSNTENQARPSSPAVIALRDKANKALQDEDPATANLLLERALRIDPSDAETYLQLARLRLANQEYAQATALAEKGLSQSPPESVEQSLKEILQLAQNPETVKASS